MIALDVQPSWHLAIVRKGTTARSVVQQALAPSDGVASLMLRRPGAISEIVLLDRYGAVLGSVRPVVAAEEAASRGSGAVALNR